MVLLYNLLRGRLDPTVYHLFGRAATGKSTIAMACAASIAATGKPCAWIDTSKGFSTGRFATISQAMTSKDHSNRILLNRATTPLATDHAIEQLSANASKWGAGLVVLDTAFGSIDQTVQDPAIRRIMWVQAREQLARLAMLANLYKIPLLVINTVGYKPGEDQAFSTEPAAEA